MRYNYICLVESSPSKNPISELKLQAFEIQSIGSTVLGLNNLGNYYHGIERQRRREEVRDKGTIIILILIYFWICFL